MEISKLFVQARSATVQIADGGLYHTKAVYQLFLNGQAAGTADTAVTSLYDLQPETEYVLSVRLGAEEVGQCAFRTARESYTLNVRQFGAVGDGVHDDTAAIQAAILHCPADGRVLIPAGRYHVLPLMLKSHVRIELRRGATLLLETDRSKFPILPGMILSTDETDDLNLGSWEGNPLDMYAAFINGMYVEDVVLYGEGVLDGQGEKGDWWQNCKVRRGAWRPRMLFLALHRYQQTVGGAQCVQRQQLQRGRTVDENEIIAVRHLPQRGLQQELPVVHVDHLHAGAGQSLAAWQHVAIGCGHDQLGRLCAVDERIVDAVAGGLVHAHAAGSVGLGVKIAQQHPLARGFYGSGQVYTGGGLAHAALLIYDRNDFRHSKFLFLSEFIMIVYTTCMEGFKRENANFRPFVSRET